MKQNMSFEAKRCGLQFSPPAIVIIYANKETKKNRKRIIPVRNFSKYSGKALQVCDDLPRLQARTIGISRRLFNDPGSTILVCIMLLLYVCMYMSIP